MLDQSRGGERRRKEVNGSHVPVKSSKEPELDNRKTLSQKKKNSENLLGLKMAFQSLCDYSVFIEGKRERKKRREGKRKRRR